MKGLLCFPKFSLLNEPFNLVYLSTDGPLYKFGILYRGLESPRGNFSRLLLTKLV